MSSLISNFAYALVVIIAIFHFAILVLEMFYWDHPVGRKIFAMSPEVSAASKVLAANQGLYNGFLAAGLLFALWQANNSMLWFFLGCVLVAGIYGGFTAKRSILITQAFPALLALILLYLTR